ncbi:MAG: HAD hydrolase-like protein [Acidobacteriota bacterium]|nr:HAD hydrolase-like protein [Acidobacteriota bacterium]
MSGAPDAGSIAPPAAARTATVILFDIDGTLVLTGGAGGRAMTRAFEELFAVPDAFRGIPMPGRTDPLILADAAARAGVDLAPEVHDRFKARYHEILRAEVPVGGPRYGVMPGVRPLLETLQQRDDVTLALLTGNYEAAARIKLEHFDLWRYFGFGAFGDEAADRNALVPLALERTRQRGRPQVTAADLLIVGDTPLDVACARAGGARVVAVATGSHGVEELAACAPDLVLADLSDPTALLDLLAR